MILKLLEMNNFLPYYNHHEIDFSPRNNRRIILLKGKNGGGKSSTFTALTFVFFGLGERGALTNADGDLVVTSKLVNTKRMREGDGVTSVTVHFDHDGSSWSFTRKINFKQLQLEDWKEAHRQDPNLTREEYSEKLNKEQVSKCSIPADSFIVVKDGATQPWDNDPARRARQQKVLIESIIPEQSNRYYFFSGEQIKRYTTQPPKDNIQKAIEKILGVKMIDNAIEDLQQLIREKYEPQIRKLGRSSSQSESHTVLAEKALEDITYQERARKTKLLEIINIKKTIKENEVTLSEFEDVERKINELKQTKSKLEDANDGIKAEETALVNYFSERYPLLLTISLLSKIQNITSTLSPQLPFISKAAKHWLEKDICQCDRPLDDEAKEKLQKLINPDNQTLDHFIECSSILIPDYGEKGLKEKWATHSLNLSHHQSEKDSLTRNIEAINQEIDVNAQSIGQEMEQTRKDHINASIQLSQEEGNLRLIETSLTTNRTKYNDEMQLAQVKNVSEPMQEVSAYKKRAEQMILSFETAKEEIVETQKANIERLASETLVSIAQETMGVSGIILDDRYTVMVMNNNGYGRYCDDPPLLSEGEKQVIAMSFVLALTNFAGQERPTFIDTPFSRLDEDYTTDVSRRLVQQSVNSQVIVLYQPSELHTEAFEILNNNAARSYRFTKLTSEQSDVRPEEET